ncbi:hypothetical protein VA596_43510 [Amycolatopsis sp., V23-08]|uniref:Uncharacterized protein n=1 Tax=Amycolatopsis heterodermiae TaxID=3110235 RepID=A0ABU5RJK2_9PSEU|nr:hypothetical protein [Amycolatopsis sp., V23-08]MEA5366462.1 hypothetical protein [Amycolatopsis sp., V23-08]
MADGTKHPLYNEHPWRLARLQVSSAAHTSVEVSGLANWLPAHHASMEGAYGVTVANYCRTTQEDHYHVRRASIDMGPLLIMPNRLGRILGDLVREPDNPRSNREFRNALRPYTRPQLDKGQNQADLSVSRYCNTIIRHGAAVQLGDHSRMNIKTHCVVEETTFQLADLLVHDVDLVSSFAMALRSPHDASLSSTFLNDTLKAAGRSDDLAMLTQISQDIRELDRPCTSIWAFFGLAQINHPSAVMLGIGNTLTTKFRVDTPKFKSGTLLADLDTVRHRVTSIEDQDLTPPLRARAVPTVEQQRSTLTFSDPAAELPSHAPRHSRTPSHTPQPGARNRSFGVRGRGL